MAWIYLYHIDVLIDPNYLFHHGTSKYFKKQNNPRLNILSF